MVESLAALPSRLDENIHLSFDVGLPDIVRERFRPHGPINQLVVSAPGTCNDTILFDAHTL
jgi:hypothetical protein